MSARVQSLFLLVLAQFALGTAAIFVRYALTGTGPLNAAFFRVLIAAPIAIGLARLAKRDLRFTRDARNRLILAGCILGFHFALWIISLQYTSVVVATLLVCTTPFWLAIYDAAVHRRFPPAATCIAFVVAASAAIVVVVHGPPTTSFGSNPLLGAVLALAAAILISFYLALMRSARHGRSTLSLIAYAYPSSLLVLGPIALIAHEPVPVTWISWGGIFGMALVTQLIGHTALAASLRNFQSSTVAFAGLSEPPISAIAASLLLNEPIQVTVVLGGIVLLAAIGVVLAQDTESAGQELTILESPSM